MIVILRWPAGRCVGQRKHCDDVCSRRAQRIHTTTHRRAGSNDIVDENHRRSPHIDAGTYRDAPLQSLRSLGGSPHLHRSARHSPALQGVASNHVPAGAAFKRRCQPSGHRHHMTSPPPTHRCQRRRCGNDQHDSTPMHVPTDELVDARRFGKYRQCLRKRLIALFVAVILPR